MKLCCDALHHLADAEHLRGRGCSFLAYELGGIPFFVLEFRTVDHGNEQRLVAAIRRASEEQGSTLGTRISEEVAMRFCPYCGTDFKKWARRNPNDFQELVARSRPYVQLPAVRMPNNASDRDAGAPEK